MCEKRKEKVLLPVLWFDIGEQDGSTAQRAQNSLSTYRVHLKFNVFQST